jgi:hydrogenase maturation protease
MSTTVHPRRLDLVIGIGNPLRGDDGVGWLLVQELSRRPSLAARCVQQLTPELVVELAAHRRVLFVDAWQAPAAARPLLRPLLPRLEEAADGLSHRTDPAGLLALCAVLQGPPPAAMELLVPARGFGHGRGLSPGLRQLLPQARQLLRSWMACTS